MMKKTKKYLIVAGNCLKGALEYRTNYIIGLIGTVFPIFMQCCIWTAIFKSSGASLLYGYTYGGLIMYSIISGLVSKLVQSSIQNEMAGDIKGGGLNKFLVQPIDYFFYKISAAGGKKVVHSVIIVIVLIVSVFSGSFFVDWDLSFIQLVAFAISVFLGLMLNHILMFCIGTLAFKFHQISGFFSTISLLTSIISGGIFPLDIFGTTFNRVMSYMPFKYIVYFQASILNGSIAGSSAWIGIAIQVLWIFVLYAFSRVVWNRGLKAYIAVGG